MFALFLVALTQGLIVVKPEDKGVLQAAANATANATDANATKGLQHEQEATERADALISFLMKERQSPTGFDAFLPGCLSRTKALLAEIEFYQSQIQEANRYLKHQLLKLQKAGHKQIGGKSYWVSWDSDEAVLKNARWNWFTARNYCRKRCMDLVAFENGNEQNAVGRLMNAGNVREVWTSGRLCDKEVDGCEADRFQPYNIRGWFWASSLQSMGETNVFNGRKFNGWSSTGPLNKPQPDGILKADGFGEQACTALLDNFFNDGLTWHDTKCNDRRHIVCEDLPVGNINFVRQQNPGVNIP